MTRDEQKQIENWLLRIFHLQSLYDRRLPDWRAQISFWQRHRRDLFVVDRYLWRSKAS
jgi:hypothetical protein